MRLNSYINDYVITKKELDIISKDCSTIMDIYSTTNPLFLLRGSDKRLGFGRISPRTDRKPRDTDHSAHNVLDELFYKKFGWKVRSEGVFTSPNDAYASGFGDIIYIIFPKNGFKYVNSNNSDGDGIYRIIRNLDITEKSPRDKIDVIKRAIDEYVDDNLQEAIENEFYSEVIVKCEYYYPVSCNHDNIRAIARYFAGER